MRDISNKVVTLRTATAKAELLAAPSTLSAVREGFVPKGDPIPIAKIAAVNAAKKTTEWIPYCHNIPIESVSVDFDLQSDRIVVVVEVKTVAKTGVEMEALTAASAAVLTLYDMLKPIDDVMEIQSIKLTEKRGGKSDWNFGSEWSGAVLTVSDRVSLGTSTDKSGPILVQGLKDHGAVRVESATVPDDPGPILDKVMVWVGQKTDIVLLTGGTGVSPRDRTPEALTSHFDIVLPGVVEALRGYGQSRTPTAMLSRMVAGVIGSTIIVTLPGSPKACEDALCVLFPALIHAKDMLLGRSHT